MVYLLKVTLAWTLFLFLFEALYKGSGRFTVNRFYLLLSLAAGLLLPLVPLPSYTPKVVSAIAFPTQVTNVPVNQQTFAVTQAQPAAMAAEAQVADPGLNALQIIYVLYIIGIGFLTIKFLFESGKMGWLIVRKPQQVVAGHKVIITGKRHAPYSFMKWIFIGDLSIYQATELEYIIRHEAAHNQQKHWVDLLLLQIASIVLWFHPLIWRYRYLLQLQHEYEADALAARGDIFSYGHFLLQQTMLKGVPSIAHSFQFSPIKNRIKMLTKKQNQKNGTWKYLLIVPALFGCTFLMAKATGKMPAARENRVVDYNGNRFAWRSTDTLSYDRVEKKAQLTPKAWKKNQIIFKMNEEPVYQNDYLSTPASNKFDNGFTGYLTQQFKAAMKNTADSQTLLMVSNVVVDKQGKVVYCERHFQRRLADYMINVPIWLPYPAREPELDKIVDKIIAESPAWKPGVVNGKPVNALVIYMGSGGGC